MKVSKKLEKAKAAKNSQDEAIIAKINSMIVLKAKLDVALDDVAQDGNWNFDPYMLGLYNGLVYAQAILENKEPEYRNIPEGGFKCNNPKIAEQLASKVREEMLVREEQQSEAFKKKILG
jgi:hypothetical protein